jgi:hypothetical protein
MIAHRLVQYVCIGVLAAALIPRPAQATRRLNGWWGRPESSNNFGCFFFGIFEGKIINHCGRANFEVPLPYENTGSKTATFFLAGPDFNSGCKIVAINNDSGVMSQSAYKRLTILNEYQLLTTGSVNAPNHGQLWLQCDMVEGAALTTVEFPQ